MDYLGSFILGVDILAEGASTVVHTESLSDACTFTDTMHGIQEEQAFTDTVTFLDVLGLVIESFQDLTDTLTFTDYYVEPFIDTLTLSDTMEGSHWIPRTLTESITLADELLLEIEAVRTLSDVVDLADTMTRTINRLAALSDTVNLTDVLDGVAAKVFGDDVTFTDVLTEFVSKVMRDVVEFEDQLQLNTVLNRGLFDQFAMGDNLHPNIFIRRTFEETVVFTDAMTGDRVIPYEDTIVLTDLMVGIETKHFDDTLTFTETVPFNRNVGLPIFDIVTFNDSLSPSVVANRQLEDTVAFLETMRGIRAHIASMTESVTFVDGMFREVYNETLSDTVTLLDTMECVKDSERDLDDTVALTDQLQLTTVTNLVTSDELLYREGFVVKVKKRKGSGYIPGTGLQEVPEPSGGYVPSSVWQGVIQVLPQVVMRGFSSAIVLPAPEFNDFVAGQGKVAVNRSMTGGYRVYAKRATREKINWRFVIPKYKADEFKAFIQAEINNTLDVIDWEGNAWSLKFLSDSVDFTETRRWAPCGNAVDVTVELVGYRYA